MIFVSGPRQAGKTTLAKLLGHKKRRLCLFVTIQVLAIQRLGLNYKYQRSLAVCL